MQVKRAEAPVDVRFVIKHRQEESGLEQRDLAAGAEVSYIPSCCPQKHHTQLSQLADLQR